MAPAPAARSAAQDVPRPLWAGGSALRVRRGGAQLSGAGWCLDGRRGDESGRGARAPVRTRRRRSLVGAGRRRSLVRARRRRSLVGAGRRRCPVRAGRRRCPCGLGGDGVRCGLGGDGVRCGQGGGGLRCGLGGRSHALVRGGCGLVRRCGVGRRRRRRAVHHLAALLNRRGDQDIVAPRVVHRQRVGADQQDHRQRAEAGREHPHAPAPDAGPGRGSDTVIIIVVVEIDRELDLGRGGRVLGTLAESVALGEELPILIGVGDSIRSPRHLLIVQSLVRRSRTFSAA